MTTSRICWRMLCSMIAMLSFLNTSFYAIAQQRMSGFSPQAARAQSEIEKKFKRIPSAEEARKHHRYFTAEPHPAGSPRNNELARHIAEQWKQQGWEDVQLRRYDVLSSYPREVSVEMTAPVRYKATLREDAYDVDPDTKNPGVRSGYLGLSASGEVTAPVVYAHSGNPEDYELLRKQGIDARGKVVIVRYSNPYSYRGFKALTAEREGAAALIIYSDPAEDGYKRGKVFPHGPWGPESHIQRGAITYDFMVPGDPLTPGWASVPGAKQIPISEARSVPKIIALPMSWRDAKPLLENMDGPVAPKDWQGGLPIKYRLTGAVQVHLKVDMDTSVMPNYVVEARIRGSEFPDEWIVMGNHRDAWEFGGVDPSSGTASMMEMTRALGELKKQGARPRRTLVVCSWDGEEVALTGSTEWGEQFADDLKKKAVVYINVDSSTSGPDFRPSAVASLAPLIVEMSRSINAPSGKTLYQEWRRSVARDQKTKAAIKDDRLVDTRIGSGSDHTVFLNFLGMPTILLQFDGPYGVYHSMYDDYYWMNQFGDPGYRYHTLMSVYWGALALRLANAEILPLDFAFYSRNIREFVRELQMNNDAKGHVNLESTQRLVAEFERAALLLNEATRKTLARGRMDSRASERVNQKLMQVETNWLNADGIPGRPWFKHILYAARYTYAHLELPGLTEAIEQKNWSVAQVQKRILEEAISKNAALLVKAREQLNR
ncbi:MAG TPA: M28 family metallopeptidase [Blastocatellia bacterium]|nr:M28 family metallopeptidase [Blastocatellia bacterium]